MRLYKLKLMALLAVFILPMVISVILYWHPQWFSLKTSQHGVLVQPAIPTGDLTANKNWKILYFPEQCQAVNSDHEMFMLHQLHRLLAEKGERVSLMIVAKTGCTFGNIHDFQPLLLTTKQYKNLQQQLKVSQLENKIYLIDPRGNLFMYYSSNIDLLKVLLDVKHVLEVSQIG